MDRLLLFFLSSVFAIFLGSQITEGCLLLPYWKSLSTAEFYTYYADFGPLIGSFYTILTIIAALIPASLSVYAYFNKKQGLWFSLISTFFALLVIVLFYFYFKGANEEFYGAKLSAKQLESALETWGVWHGVRVFIEVLSLVFLCLGLSAIGSKQLRSELSNLEELKSDS